MKRILMAAAAMAGGILISCNNTADNTGTSSSGNGTDSTAEKYKQINRDIMKGIETGDSAKFSGIADDGIDHSGPGGQEVKGGANVRTALMDMHNHFKDLKIDIKNEAVNGDYLYSWSTLSGTTTDASMHVPAGTAVSWTGVDILKFKDGKAYEHWGYIDPKDMMPPGGNAMDSSTRKGK